MMDAVEFQFMRRKMDLILQSKDNGLGLVEKMVSENRDIYLTIEFSGGIIMVGHFTPSGCTIPDPGTPTVKKKSTS